MSQSLDGHLKTIVSIAIKTTIGYIPVVGPLVSAFISEYQSQFQSEASNKRILEIASLIKRDPSFRVPMRMEILERIDTTHLPEYDLRLNCKLFDDWLIQLDSDMNVAEKAYLYGLIVFVQANNKLGGRAGNDDATSVVLSKAASIAKEIEESVLLDQSVSFCYYWRLSHFIKRVVRDELSSIAVLGKAVDYSGDIFLAMGAFLDIYNSCLVANFNEMIIKINDRQVAYNIWQNKVREIEFVKNCIDEIMENHAYVDSSYEKKNSPQIVITELFLRPGISEIKKLELYAKQIIISKVIGNHEFIDSNRELFFKLGRSCDGDLMTKELTRDSLAATAIQRAIDICNNKKD